jgi:hypothetical protein
MPQLQSKFHIEDDAGPDEIYQYLDTVVAESPTDIDSLQSGASRLGHTIGSTERVRVGPLLARLGVVKTEDQFTPTEMGDRLIDIMYNQPRLFSNILHYLYYTAVDRYPDRHIYTSSTYQLFTNYIHRNGPYESFHGSKGTIVNDVDVELQQQEGIDPSRATAGISISTKTFNGFLRFLVELEPSVNPNGPDETPGYSPRGFCPPELLVLAVDYLYQQTGTEYGTLLALTEEVRTPIERLCLLSGDGVESVADFADDSFGFFSTNYDFGQNYLLDHSVSLDDIA